MPNDEHREEEEAEAQFVQSFRGADIRSGDGTGGGRGGDIGSYNNVNSNNITNNMTIHIHSEEQLVGLGFSLRSPGLQTQLHLPTQVSASLSRQGSRSRLHSNSGNPNILYGSHPQFIFNEGGQALDLSNNDQRTVLSWPFHGGQNQQWFLSDDGQGKTAFMCIKNRRYLAVKRLEENAALFLSITPLYWDVSPHGEKYRISIPKSAQGLSQSNLALSIDSHVASLRPYFETLNTMLYILEDTIENRAKIRAMESTSTDDLLTAAPPNTARLEDDTPINLDGRSNFFFNQQGQCLDLSGNDHQTVIPWGFHGHWNQQWAFVLHDDGFVAVKSLLYPVYIAFEQPVEDAGVFCTPQPVYWKLSRDKDGFNLGVPGSHLGLALGGQAAKLRPLYEHRHTRLYLLENSEATAAEIRRGDFLRAVALYNGNLPPEIDAPGPSHLEPFTSTIEESCLIVSYTGTVLDLSRNDRRVYAFGYHGGDNQQWVIHTDGRGGATIQSLIVPHYVKYRELQLDSQLLLDPSPFTWEMTKDGDGYKLSVPGTNFVLSLGVCARLRYRHEQPGTCVYLMDNSPQSRTHIQSGVVSSSTLLPKIQKPRSVHNSGDLVVHDIPTPVEQPNVTPTTSEASKVGKRPIFGKTPKNLVEGSTSSSNCCIVQ